MLHLAPEKACLDLEPSDALGGFVRKPVELAVVDEQADRQLLTVLLDHVLVAGHGAARDLHLFEAAHAAAKDVHRTTHRTEC